MCLGAPHVWRPSTSVHLQAVTACMWRARFLAVKKLAWLAITLTYAQGAIVPGQLSWTCQAC